jgi:hypothetical protein
MNLPQPVTPRLPRTLQERDTQRRLIVILQKATLETTKVGKAGAYELLNCDDHQGILRKNNRDIADCRPDITHQVGAVGSVCRVGVEQGGAAGVGRVYVCENAGACVCRGLEHALAQCLCLMGAAGAHDSVC